jgi:1-acyl-sn-glycerol-3-phosphate acyltransferase
VIIRPLLARAFWALSGYRLRSEPLPEGPAVLIGAPHTTNWDFAFMLAICWPQGVSPSWLGKKSLFKPPFGALVRALGGISVDRANPAGLVEQIGDQVKQGGRHLVIAPEGTRGKGEYWKSGFYRIARHADIPVVLGYVDSVTRTAGVGPAIHLSGDPAADMDRIREFYADKQGVHPANRTEPRLRSERSQPD